VTQNHVIKKQYSRFYRINPQFTHFQHLKLFGQKETKITNIAENHQKFVQALPVLSGLKFLNVKFVEKFKLNILSKVDFSVKIKFSQKSKISSNQKIQSHGCKNEVF